MNKIIINPHYCSREEYQELIDYLEEQCWSYTTEKNYKIQYLNLEMQVVRELKDILRRHEFETIKINIYPYPYSHLTIAHGELMLSDNDCYEGISFSRPSLKELINILEHHCD